MNIKNRLAKLEQHHTDTASRKRINLISTPETRTQAAAELDVWRREMFAKGIPSDNEGHIYQGDEIETRLAELRANDQRRWASVDGMAANRAKVDAVTC